MDKRKVANRLLRVARSLVADMTRELCNADVSNKQAVWTPVRRDVDVSMRNQEVLKSLTTFAPGLSKEMRKRMTVSLKKQGYDIRPQDLVRDWSQYLVYVDEEANSNKYHYYVVYHFYVDGDARYIAGNCSGRIGIVERAYDLTEKFYRGAVSSLNLAVAAAERHLKTKISKGYAPIKMTRG